MSAPGRALQAAWYRGAPWLWLLRPLELLFRGVATLRRWLYRRGVLSSYRAAVPVVVVGNVSVGGTGKTPVVIALVEALQALGLRPGVVSRGYGARPGEFPRRVRADADADEAGDEPLLIARRTGVPLVIDPDRARAVRELLRGDDVDLVIADDGLQHYALARDFEIAVVDAGRGLGNGWCLPSGPLREPPSRLHSVDRVLYRGGEGVRDTVRYQPREWVNLHSGESRPAAAFGDAGPVSAVAGIGQPAQFFHTLGQLGIDFEPRIFADHHRYREQDFAGLGGRPILMTEKDAVKCKGLAGHDMWYLRIDASLPQDLAPAVADLVARSQSDAGRGNQHD